MTAPDLPADALRRALLAFFDARARDLPWRATDDPYAIWVSEVMLQQTRVETVIPYFRRWLEAFPDVDALASTPREEVLKAWEGLGYYRRARMLHDAARVVRDRHGGRLPDTVEGLGELPGVGPYTAGAVASIAFGRQVPAVDGNVRRVLSRLLDLPDPGAARLRREAGRLVDPERPGDFNQALMELGATVCVPRGPACPRCPVASWCRARAAGTQEERPRPRETRTVPTASFGVAVVLADGVGEEGPRALLVRRPEEGMLGGMWEFPGGRLSRGEPAEAGAVRAAREAGVEGLAEGRELEPVEHVYSHLRATYIPVAFRVPVARGEEGDDVEGRRWVGTEELADLPLPRAQRRIARAVPGLGPPGGGKSGARAGGVHRC